MKDFAISKLELETETFQVWNRKTFLKKGLELSEILGHVSVLHVKQNPLWNENEVFLRFLVPKVVESTWNLYQRKDQVFSFHKDMHLVAKWSPQKKIETAFNEQSFLLFCAKIALYVENMLKTLKNAWHRHNFCHEKIKISKQLLHEKVFLSLKYNVRTTQFSIFSLIGQEPKKFGRETP